MRRWRRPWRWWRKRWGGGPGGPGPRTYLAGLLRRRCAADPELRATLAEGWRRHQELGTWLAAGDADPAGLLAATFTLGQLAYALHGDPSLRDLHLASTTPA